MRPLFLGDIEHGAAAEEEEVVVELLFFMECVPRATICGNVCLRGVARSFNVALVLNFINTVTYFVPDGATVILIMAWEGWP